jgi:hypothetical protein
MADPPPSATQEQQDNSIEITLKNFQSESVSFCHVSESIKL